MTESVDFVITDETWDQNFEDVSTSLIVLVTVLELIFEIIQFQSIQFNRILNIQYKLYLYIQLDMMIDGKCLLNKS